MAPRVIFDRVWKKFQRGERHDTLRDIFLAAGRRALSRQPQPTELAQREFWAVQDVSFDVAEGEALGIIGPNGAGKSTTLKLLTRILRATRGECRVVGRVGALIEVAAGFHPDLTGRENVFLQGAIMGMRRHEIATKLDEIIEFAGVRDFIDTPVKRYSSGMNARLGFAIAAHLNPDVLIIDEVLSVGDSAFQERCVRRMREFKQQGVTIVFVSHNLQAVSTLCDRAILLQRSVRAYGPTDAVLRTYVQEHAVREDLSTGHTMAIVSSSLEDGHGSGVDGVSPGSTLHLHVEYAVADETSDLTFGFNLFRATDGLAVYEGHYTDTEIGRTHFRAGERFTIAFDFSTHLVKGAYYAECYVMHNPTHTWLAQLSPAGMFTVDEARSQRGIVDIDLRARLLHDRPVVVHRA